MRGKTYQFIFLSLFVACCIGVNAQTSTYMLDKLIITSEDKAGKTFKCQTESCYMLLNVSNGDFTLSADLSVIRTGDKKTDSTLAASGQQTLVFKGNINENILRFNQQQNDEKNYDMPGQLMISDNSITCTAQFDPINLADKSDSKNYRMDFILSIDAGKLKIKGLEEKLYGAVVFEVGGGKLNIQN